MKQISKILVVFIALLLTCTFIGCSDDNSDDNSSNDDNDSETSNGEFYYDNYSEKYKGHFTWTATNAIHQVLIEQGHFAGFYLMLIGPEGSNCFAGGSGFATESNELIVYHSWSDIGYSPNRGDYSNQGYVVTGNIYDLTDGNISMVDQYRNNSDISVKIHLLWRNVPDGFSVPDEIVFSQKGYYSRN